MTSTFTTNKTLELPANGDYVNTWNIPVNSDMTVIDTALGGTTNLNATAGSATLTYTQYRPLILSVSGAVSANVTYTIPSGVGGQWIVRNAMTDSSGGPWDLIFASGGGGTSVIVSRGFTTTIYSDGTNISYSDSRLSTAAGSNRQIQYNNNGVLGASSTFVYDATGNVGIGTSSPTSLGGTNLNIKAPSSSTYGSILIESGTYIWEALVNQTSGVMSMGARSNHALTFAVNDTERMRIDTSGNVGIGTASPGTKLQVAGTINSSTGSFTSTGSNFASIAFTGTSLNLSGVYVGLDAAGNLAINVRDSGAQIFSTNNAERMRIDSSGNVGIGLSNPAVKADINGVMRAATWSITGTGVAGGTTAFSAGTVSTDTNWGMYFRAPTGSAGTANYSFRNSADTALMTIDSSGNVIAGGSVALATTATNGFLYVPTCAGTPTGTPTAVTGMAPIVVDTTNNKLYFYSGGAWRDAGP